MRWFSFKRSQKIYDKLIFSKTKLILIYVAVLCVHSTQTSAQPNLPSFAVGDIQLQVQTVAVLPNSQGVNLPTGDRQGSYDTRMNFLKQIQDGRRFVNDERGRMYTLNDPATTPTTFLNFQNYDNALWNRMQFGTGNAAGFVTFEFHPEFLNNQSSNYGKFYTIHTEVASKAHNAGFNNPYIPANAPGTQAYDLNDLNHHTIISEWQMDNPLANNVNSSNTTRRELLRAGHPSRSYFHPFGDMQFNPYAQNGDDDYGLLYITGGDWGFINGGGAGGADGSTDASVPGALQRLDTLAGSFIRIDPNPTVTTDRVAGIGDYTVPTSNPFANDGDSNTLAEIYAYGFRNAHRMAWDTDGTIIISDVGEAKVEEVNIVHAGRNYGWSDREGTFINGLDRDDGGNGNGTSVFYLDVDTDDADDDFLYPIIQYDHNGSRGDQAISGGFVYHGDAIPELQGKFVFGDMNLGRIYYADWEQMKTLDLERLAGTADLDETVTAYELQLLDEEGNVRLLTDFVSDNTGSSRTDLRFGMGIDGEIYLLTGPDGHIREFVSLVPEPAALPVLIGLSSLLTRRRRL